VRFEKNGIIILKEILKLIILARQTSAKKQVLQYLTDNQLNHVGSSGDNSSFSHTHFFEGITAGNSLAAPANPNLLDAV
jgi:hypothetical protein